LNDGRGSPALLLTAGADIVIKKSDGTVKNEWLDEVHADTTAPEFFSVQTYRDPKIYEGKYFLAWSTTDKQTGVDHYEVLETDPGRFGFFRNIGTKSHWMIATSPYILSDQFLRSKIMVKAIDKMGNERIVEYTPKTAFIDGVDNQWFAITILLSLSVFFATFIITKRNQKKKI
jgi:hypothetical protein